MRRPVVVGNWKMHFTANEGAMFAGDLKKRLSDIEDRDIIVAPSFVALESVGRQIQSSNIYLAGQNLHWAMNGAHTGEVSASMLRNIGCKYVIIGHSERRQHFAETDGQVNRKVIAALSQELVPIVCIGETLEQRKAEQTWTVLTTQILQGLIGISESRLGGLMIAYEPVWAIGTGLSATPEQAQEAHAFIRGLLAETWPRYVAESCCILYGGSVNPDNVDSLMALPDVDGVLVGGASLVLESFVRIAKFAR